MTSPLHGIRIKTIQKFNGLPLGSVGTIWDVNIAPYDVHALAREGEIAIVYDDIDDWWYSTPEEEGITWQRI